MCGIYGFLTKNSWKVNYDLLHESFDLMKRRGPDSSRFWHNEDSSVFLGHHRLSIVDLSSSSSQPFFCDKDRVVIVFNGELYNFIEIRTDLIALGHRFRTDGDTEVVLRSYLEWGAECVNRFNGMWAFCIYDRREAGDEKVFLSRDRLGVKPLYYCNDGDGFSFASDPKALHSRGPINRGSLAFYLYHGYCPSNKSLFTNHKKLPPGHNIVYSVSTHSFSSKKYWWLADFESNHAINTPLKAAELYWEIFLDSVRLRCRADVELAVMQSSGLDSTMVLEALSAIGQDVETYTLESGNQYFNEAPLASEISSSYGFSHHTVAIDYDYTGDFDNAIYCQQEPLADSSYLAAYITAKKVSTRFKVAISGDGGDETLGGYRHYSRYLADQGSLLSSPLLDVPFYLISNLGDFAPIDFKGRSFLQSLHYGYGNRQSAKTNFFSDYDIMRLTGFPSSEARDKINEIRAYQYDSHFVSSRMRYDFCNTLPCDYLHKVDSAGMASSVEVRSPFLDYRLAEFMFKRVPDHLKATPDKRRILQYELRKRFRRRSESIAKYKKQGFSIPVDKLIVKDLLISRADSLNEYGFNKKYLSSLFNSDLSRPSVFMKLYNLAVLSVHLESHSL